MSKALKIIYTLLFIGAVLFDFAIYYRYYCITEYDIWPNGKVYYRYLGDFTDTEKKTIRSTMDMWEYSSKFNISFIYNSKELDKVCYIVKVYNTPSNISFATVGYNEKLNYCFFDSSVLDNKNVIAHELGHVIGFVHEHQRPDRDMYVNINYNNITKGYRYAFEKSYSREYIYDYKLFPYDYDSIMHYPSFVFCKNWELPTVVTKKGEYIMFNGISSIDQKKVQLMYRRQ